MWYSYGKGIRIGAIYAYCFVVKGLDRVSWARLRWSNQLLALPKHGRRRDRRLHARWICNSGAPIVTQGEALNSHVIADSFRARGGPSLALLRRGSLRAYTMKRQRHQN